MVAKEKKMGVSSPYKLNSLNIVMIIYEVRIQTL